ncbi:MAG: HD domain-containing protein [Actinomycetes bacterium]
MPERLATPVDLDDLLDLLEEGAAYDDAEEVDLLAHGLQCAAALAEAVPDDLELQVAGLVHDIGHIVYARAEGHSAEDEDAHHAAVGAAIAAPLLGDRVAFLVRHHVDAKRYLVSNDPAYADALSPRSVESLTAQGGTLTDGERAILDHSHDLDALVALRRADDAAKVPGARVPGLVSWLPVLRTVAGHLDDG